MNKYFQVISQWYYDIENFSEGYLCVEKDDKFGFIKITGQEVIPLIYDDESKICNGLALVEKDDKEFFIDIHNNIISSKYDDIGSFNNGIAVFQLGNKYGYINDVGIETINAEFEYAESFKEGLAKVKKRGDEDYMYINVEGAKILSNTNTNCPWVYNSDEKYFYCKFWKKKGFVSHLISKEIMLPPNAKLLVNWSHKFDKSYPDDKLEVRVWSSTKKNWTTIKKMNGISFNSADGARNFIPGSFVSELIDLSEFKNESIYIDFVGTSGYGPFLFIKDITIRDIGKINLFPLS